MGLAFFLLHNSKLRRCLLHHQLLPFEVYQGNWVIVGVVSHLVFIPIGLAVRILIPKSAFKHRLAPALNLFLFALAGLIKNFVEVLLALQLGVMTDPRWLLNLTSGAFGMVYLILIFVSVFGERLRHLSTISTLVANANSYSSCAISDKTLYKSMSRL